MANPLDELDAPANPLDEFDKPPPPAGLARQFVGGISKAIVDTATLPYRAITEGGRDAYARRMEMEKAGDYSMSWLPAIPPDVADKILPRLENMSLYRPFVVQPEPQGVGEKFARSTGEAIGSAAVPEAAIASRAKQLSRLAPVVEAPGVRAIPASTVPREMGRQIGERFVEAPKSTLATGVVASATSGAATEAARQAELGPGFEVAAGTVAPTAVVVAPAAATRTARTLLRIPEDAFTPTAARWKADANSIFERLGIHASADGSVPGETFGGQAAAYMVLANTLRRANVSPDQLDTLLERIATARRFNSNSYAPDATALVDLDPSLQKLAGSLMRENPEVWRNAVDFMYARQTGLTPTRGDLPASAGIPSREMMSPPITGKQAQDQFGTTFGTAQDKHVPMGQRERVSVAFKKSLHIDDAEFHGHAPTAEMTDAQLEAFAGSASKPLYDAVRTAGKGVDLRPTVGPILDRWEAALENQVGPVRAQLKRQISELRRLIEPRQGGITRGTDSPIERFDNWKRFLDEDIGKHYKAMESGKNKITGNVLQQFKTELLHGVDAVDPNTGAKIVMPGVDAVQDNGLGAAYSKARSVFSSVADSRRALEMGGKIWKGEAGINEFNTLEGDQASQKLVRLGMHGGYEADTKNMPRGHDVTKLFDKPRLQEVLSELIPRSKGNGEFADVPERFGRYLGHEQMIQGTPKRTFQGSPTAERIADDKAANELFDLTDQLKKGGWQQVVSNFAADTLSKMFGYRADTAATLGRVLFSADPAQRAEAIRNIRRVMTQDEFSQFQRLMDGQSRRIIQTGAASVGAAPDAQPVHVSTPQEADKLPPGTHIITPDGRHKRVP